MSKKIGISGELKGASNLRDSGNDNSKILTALMFARVAWQAERDAFDYEERYGDNSVVTPIIR